jgi:hypothetical protein
VAHQRRQIADAGGVDRPVGLVEQHQRRILQHDPGKERALQLAARERADRTLSRPFRPTPSIASAMRWRGARGRGRQRRRISRHRPMATKSWTTIGKLLSSVACWVR